MDRFVVIGESPTCKVCTSEIMMEELITISPEAAAGGGVAVFMALVVVYVIIKDVVKPLIQRRNGDSPSDRQAMIKDLHDWHAPDAYGVQSWRGAQTDAVLKSIDVHLKEQTEETRKLTGLLHELLRDRRNEAKASRPGH